MRLIKIAGIILFTLFLLGIGINYWASQKILTELEKVGTISCTDVAVNVFAKTLTIQDFQLEKNLPSKTDTVQILHAHIAEFALVGCDYLNFLLNNELCLGNITLEKPIIKIIEQLGKNEKNLPKDSTQNKSKKILKSLNIKDVFLKNGQFVAIKQEQKWLKVDTFFTNLSGFSMDFKSDSSTVDWEAIESDFKTIQLNSAAAKNKLLIAQVLLQTKEKQCLIKDIKWHPKQSKSEFKRSLTFRKARLNLDIQEVIATEFDLKKLWLQQTLAAEKINIATLNLKIHSNKNIPACEDCYKPYLHEVFQKIPFKIAINNIVINENSRLQYEEVALGKNSVGKLKFEQLYVSINNLKHEEKALTSIDIQSKFMNKAMVKVHFDCWLNSPNQDYAFSGDVNHLSLESINPFLAYTANARIQKGEVSGLLFNGIGDKNVASGDMQFNYKNLEIALLGKKRKKKKLLSKIVNKLLVVKENPDGKKINKGKMYFERKTNKSFISNWWKTIQSGFQSTMFPDILLQEELKKN